ncbi:MAG: tRNA pseudouridine(13) synthase TruD [Candidatus Bipolaricaulota bacterium]|nr:tRNA pseudouridine(13) synthase TruD [Candidatus Bipolaricaulota bacterium]
MRFKVLPEDFRVEELLGPPPQGRGNYALWRVEKRDLTTLEAQTFLAARLGLPPRAVSFPALKDKRAVAVQYATTPHAKGLPQGVKTARLRAERVGSWPAPLSPRDLAGNRFTVVLRDLAPAEAEDVRARFALLAQQGFPNYFDLQRFGSFSARLGFPGKLLLRGDWEGALRAYLAEPLLGDPPSVRRFKALARERWGDWKFLKEAAPRGNLRSVLTFLCDHPQDFKRAVNLITPRVLSLWLSAYQSFLWNRGASRALEELVGEARPWPRFASPGGRWPCPVTLWIRRSSGGSLV